MMREATCEMSWFWPAPCRNSMTGAKLDSTVSDTGLLTSALSFCSFGPRITSIANCQQQRQMRMAEAAHNTETETSVSLITRSAAHHRYAADKPDILQWVLLKSTIWYCFEQTAILELLLLC